MEVVLDSLKVTLLSDIRQICHLADLSHPGNFQLVDEAELFSNFAKEEVEFLPCWV